MSSKKIESSQAKSRNVLSNEQLTERLTDLEERVSRLEASSSLNVTWGVRQVELAETKRKPEE